jgi:hypothetical protein
MAVNCVDGHGLLFQSHSPLTVAYHLDSYYYIIIVMIAIIIHWCCLMRTIITRIVVSSLQRLLSKK